MERSLIINFLEKVEILKDLNREELMLLYSKMNVRNVQSTETLFSENTPRKAMYFIYNGSVILFKKTPYGEEKILSMFTRYDFLGEGSLVEDSPHSTSSRALLDSVILELKADDVKEIFNAHGEMAVKVYSRMSRIVTRRLGQTNTRIVNSSAQYESGRTREEHDLLGYRNVPHEYYYGIQTLRALENFNISGVILGAYPDIVVSLAQVKKGAAIANNNLGLMDDEITEAIKKACDEIINNKFHGHFVVDMIQGGAGTSTNMNANEVIANRALEHLGHEKGEYQYCHPNNHVNLSQSTNDAYPTAVKIALIRANKKLITVLKELIASFRKKSIEFKDVIKMGRTQLQDAVPMTLGQSFEAYADTFEYEIERLTQNAKLFHEINMGATAIGTGINADPDYADEVTKALSDVTGEELTLAKNLVEATQDTAVFIMYSSVVKRLAVKLSKVCNDIRLLSSGPRCGLNEINIPKMQPGSSIMPGKVNPVIPEVVNQIAFKVIGNDLTVTLAVEAGQLELNVMEPVIVQSLFESIEMLKNGMNTLIHRCINGITANREHCKDMVLNSIGLVTALNPYLGYENSTIVAKEALETGRGIYELVIEKGMMDKETLDDILKPENMVKPRKFKK
ncbi:MAG: aspartate ammonia-lyase [Candidatus Delongbacteria bacterium]|nr:aspartate ammonia-lyase [Candidatus Delongbacteria bacterium]MBN2834522.1 aspartate ammonia-lyase [Candidatus Delongbacteria bacterium]